MLKATYETADAIPEGVRDYYGQPEGEERFVLQVDSADGFALENVSGLKSTLGKLKDRADRAEAGLKRFSSLNAEPDAIAQNLAELESLRESKQDEGTAVTSLRNEMEQMRKSAKEETDKAIAPINSLAESRLAQIKELLIDNELSSAISEAGGSSKLLMPVLRNEVRAVTDDEGRVKVQIVDGEGTPRVMGTSLEPMTFGALVEEKKNDPDLAIAFSSAGSSGGGSQPDTTQTGASTTRVTPEAVGSMSMAEYRKFRQG
jgi:hypothetical protein